MHESIFRENDIRGTYPEELNELVIKDIARGIAKKCKAEEVNSIAVARDGRLSGESLLSSFCEAMISYGLDVNCIGLATSPMLYFAAKKENSKSGIMITGSHNPKDYNGIKMVVNNSSVSGNEILTLINDNGELSTTDQGQITYNNIKDIYIEEVINNVEEDLSNLKVVLDCGNGVAGHIAPDLFKKLGCEVIELYSDVDGNFPNHHPDPGKLENLKDIILEVKKQNADIGFAFDGDGDRVGLITNKGEMIFPDKQMMLFSKDILKDKSGGIVFDVKCSNHLENIISSNGGKPIMSPTGHFHIKNAIKKNNALLGGEMSGHIFFNDQWYGFDDAIYAGARLLSILARKERIQEFLNSLPDSSCTPELKMNIEGFPVKHIMSKLKSSQMFPKSIELNFIDGIRVEYEKGFGLVRPSNTTPSLVFRFEGDDLNSLEQIKNEFRVAMKRVLPSLKTPF